MHANGSKKRCERLADEIGSHENLKNGGLAKNLEYFIHLNKIYSMNETECKSIQAIWLGCCRLVINCSFSFSISICTFLEKDEEEDDKRNVQQHG